MTRFEIAVVWAGGALFVASLLVTAHAFLETWGEVRALSATWRQALGIDAALVTAFALHHSVFARDGAKAVLARLVPSQLVRSLYVWIASLLLIAVVWSWQPIGGVVYEAEGRLAWLLRLVQLTGVALIAASVRAIDPLDLAGIRAASPGTSLYLKGPYALVRHPLYLGWVLIVFAATAMTGDRLAFAALTTLYLIIAMPWEERSLLRAYGDVYRRYTERVRWRLLPLVY